MSDPWRFTLLGEVLAPAWCAVSLAASDDGAIAALYRTVAIDPIENGLVLQATDAYWSARAFVPFEPAEWEDTFAEAPPADRLRALMTVPLTAADQRVVRDVDHRLRALMVYVKKRTAKKGAAPVPIELWSPTDRIIADGVIEATLSGDLEPEQLVVSLPLEERLILDRGETPIVVPWAPEGLSTVDHPGTFGVGAGRLQDVAKAAGAAGAAGVVLIRLGPGLVGWLAEGSLVPLGGILTVRSGS